MGHIPTIFPPSGSSSAPIPQGPPLTREEGRQVSRGEWWAHQGLSGFLPPLLSAKPAAA